MTQSPHDPLANDPFPGDALDELLGLDPAPRLSPGAAARIHAHLADADSAALDGLLALDDVAVPEGLAARIKRDARPVAPARWLRLVPLVVASFAAAAGVLFFLRVGGDGRDAATSTDAVASSDAPAGSIAMNMGSTPGAPSDELLAALPVLEDLEFLTEELDPLEAEALFLFDDVDDVLYDLVSDAGLLEDDR